MDARLEAAHVSTYPPRTCGIATFTRDLSRALLAEKGVRRNRIIVVDDEKRNFASEVEFVIDKNDRKSYADAAARVNSSPVSVVSLQHEYGIFGGEAGEYILCFSERLKKPLITTFHTVLQNPSEKEEQVVRRLSEKSRLIVVTVVSAAETVRKRFGVDAEKIRVIQHGAPVSRGRSRSAAKRRLGLSGRTVLATFGLISRAKGIEYAIQALPRLVRAHPTIIYMVVGKTHPEVLKYEGESYRDETVALARALGVEDRVRFVNRYLNSAELASHLRAVDIYLAPYTGRDQVSSGTITAALGYGKAVVSTPTVFAAEVLAAGRGLLCSFQNSHSLAASVNRLLTDTKLRRSVERHALAYGQGASWSKIANQYAKAFSWVAARADREENSGTFCG